MGNRPSGRSRLIASRTRIYLAAKPMTKQTRLNLWYALLAIFGIMLMHNAWTAITQIARIP
jgi:hypothetical protein